MKLIYLGVILCLGFLSFQISAQPSDLRIAIELKESIVKSYNGGDYKAIYNMADPPFRQDLTEDSFVNFLKSQVEPFGKIVASELIEDLGEVKYFQLDFEAGGKKQSLQLSLGAISAKEFSIFGLSRIRPDRDKPAQSDNPLKTKIDLLVDKSARSYLKNLKTVGLSIGVVHDGKIYTYNYGESERGGGKLPTANSFYEIGSITKTFTGILLAQAVVERRVKLDDDIRKYLDSNFPNLEYNSKPITLRDLATHTSGIPSVTDNVKDIDYVNPWENFSKDQLIDALHRVKIERMPGEKMEYSNSAVGLLGNILEKVFGMSYEKLVAKYIAKPAKMKETKIQLTNIEMLRFVKGHNNEKVIPYWNVRGIEGAGALRSTVNDMIKYAQYNIATKNKAVRMAHQSFFQETGSLTQMGLGWQSQKMSSGILRQTHGGGTGGFRTYCTIFPEIKLGIVVMTNNVDIDPVRVVDEIYYRLTKK